MKDIDKTKEQLINELEEMRQRLAELEASETKRNQMEKALRESEKRYRTIVEDQTELICRFLPDRTLTFVNEAYCRYFGKKREELIGHSFMPFILNEDREKIEENIASLSRKNFVTTYEHRVLAPNGESCWQQWTNRAIFDKGGCLIEFQAVGRDITERKQAEEELRKQEEKYRSLVSHIPDAVWTTDKNWRVVFVSPNIEAVCGYTQEEEYEIGEWMSWYESVHPDDVENAKAAFSALIEGKKHYDIEYRFKRKDGRWIWIHDRSVGTYEKDGMLYADGLISDITERKQAEKKLCIFQQRLQSLASQMSLAEERERRRLAAGLHDQVTQTLAVIKIKLGTMQELPSSNGHTKQLDKVRGLVDQVIQETRSLTFDLSPPILYELGLEAAVEWLTEQFQEQHGIACEFEDDCQPKPLGDDHRGILFVAVRELLMNVVKHAQARTVRISIRREDNKVRIGVRDDGVGFNSFEMERRTSGFGLFSIRERLRHLGGHVEVESDCGCGTCVTLIAPLQSSRETTGGKLT